MKWIAISGSWRHTPPKLIQDLTIEVLEIISQGWGIVTGGALGVDYLATKLVLEHSSPQKIKIFLPTSLQIYANHYHKRAGEGVISHQQAQDLIAQLTQVQQLSKESLIENHQEQVVDQDSYFQRNTKIIESADELIAFWVNKSAGTLDTINKAKEKGVKVRLYEYEV